MSTTNDKMKRIESMTADRFRQIAPAVLRSPPGAPQDAKPRDLLHLQTKASSKT